MTGLGRFIRDLWTLAKFVAKVCFWLSVPFAFLSFYYFNYFHIRHFEDPAAGLNFVTDTDATARNDFRKRTVSAFTKPLRQQPARIKKLRKQTKGGTVRPSTLERDATQIRNRLRQIKTEARLRRIPIEFKRNYEPAIFALQDAFRSINDLEDSFDQETVAARKKLYNHSIKNWKAAEKKNKTTHDFFSRDESPRSPKPKEPRWRTSPKS